MERPTIAYMPERSPTGHAIAVLVTRAAPGSPWTYLPDEGGPRRIVPDTEPLYATAPDAHNAARIKWRCVQGRYRGRAPDPITEGE